MLQQTLDVEVLGIRRVYVDGNTYTKLYLSERVDDGDVKGVIPMTMPAEPALVDQLQPAHLPGRYKLRVRLQMAGGGKTGMHALGILPDDAPGASSSAASGSASAGDQAAKKGS